MVGLARMSPAERRAHLRIVLQRLDGFEHDPRLFTNRVRVGFGLSFGILVAAELIAADRGMGFLVMQSRQIGELGVAVFGILLIGVVSLLSDAVLAAGLRRVIGRGIQQR